MQKKLKSVKFCLRRFKMTENISSFEDWSKMDLRVGEIVEVEDVESADKLWKLTVDLGEEKRTICAGLKQYYSDEELLNKKIVVVANLVPRKMRGIESQGMLLAAVNDDESKVVLICPEKNIDNGSKVR